MILTKRQALGLMRADVEPIDIPPPTPAPPPAPTAPITVSIPGVGTITTSPAGVTLTPPTFPPQPAPIGYSSKPGVRDWCERNYPEAVDRANCIACNKDIEVLWTFVPPWTVGGQLARGLPPPFKASSDPKIRDWCDRVYPMTSADGRRLCQQCNVDLLPYNWAPWTDVGAGMRNLPKDSLLANAISLVRIPTLAEYDPEVMYPMQFTDTARFAILQAYALPVTGGAIAATYYGPGGLAAAVAISVARGGWPRAWEKIGLPIITFSAQYAEMVLGYFLSGPSGAAAPAIKMLAKQVYARGPAFHLISACMEAIAGMSGAMIDAIRDPTRFKQGAIYMMLGDGLIKIADTIQPKDPTGAGFVRLSGEAIRGCAGALDLIFRGAPAAEVLNRLSFDVIGVDFITLQQDDKRRQDALAARPQAIDVLKRIFGTIEAIAAAVGEAFKHVPAIEKGIGDFINLLRAFVEQTLGAAGKPVRPPIQAPPPAPITTTQAPPTGAQPTPPPAAKPPPGASASPPSGQPPPATQPPGSQPPGKPPAKGLSWGPVVTGAGAGFLVGSAPGAVVGAGAGLFLALKKGS